MDMTEKQLAAARLKAAKEKKDYEEELQSYLTSGDVNHPLADQVINLLDTLELPEFSPVNTREWSSAKRIAMMMIYNGKIKDFTTKFWANILSLEAEEEQNVKKAD